MTSIQRILAALVAAGALLLGVFTFGKSTQKQKQRVEELESFVKTEEKINEVNASPDRNAAIERMRRNGLIRDFDL